MRFVKPEYCRDEGISATVWPLNTCWLRVLVTSTVGASPETMIVSATPPTFRSAFTDRDEAAGQLDAFALGRGNPVSVNVTVYVPGLRFSMEY